MSHPFVSAIRLVVLAGAALLLSACASTQFNAQWLNPQAGGRLPVRNVLVIGISRDTTARRVYEDAMVAQLTVRGVKAQPSYRTLPDDGPAPQPAIEKAVRDAGADAVLISRTVSVTNEVRVSPGMVMGPPYGFGWGGFYGYYHGMWSSAYAIPPSVYTVQNVVVDTRLFDAKDFVVLWSGSSTTTPTTSMQTTITDFVTSLVTALAGAKAI
ncbi:MAG TPA: hypothetical protein VFN64_07700 [Burkholderiaceae bacterium]|nr:hypothetical protein [Burkholderiaceae bacterium]